MSKELTPDELNNVTGGLHYKQNREPEETFMFYIIRPGDTLKSIAERFGTTEQKLLDINGIVMCNFEPGTMISVPR